VQALSRLACRCTLRLPVRLVWRGRDATSGSDSMLENDWHTRGSIRYSAMGNAQA